LPQELASFLPHFCQCEISTLVLGSAIPVSLAVFEVRPELMPVDPERAGNSIDPL
jgi:hypothetical protein